MFKVGDKVRIEKTEGYVSPLSILEFPPEFKLIRDPKAKPDFLGEVGELVEIDTRLIWPDLYKYIVYFSQYDDKMWVTHWWLKKVEE